MSSAAPTGLETGSGEVVTPLSDHGNYKSIVISNNGLEVLLVSDKETSKCGASMSIGVGSNDDPVELDGLTHLLEHMLYNASTKYPDGGFTEYVTQHGGEWNGLTERGYMVLSFEVNKEAFKDALDRFAQSFIEPIFSDEATNKEVKVVDKEYTEKSLILERLHRHISKEGHPYNIFGDGNLETLLITPSKRGLNITDELEKFYKKNFCATIMRLVIYSNESLPKIEKLVRKKFKKIKNKGRGPSPDPGLPFTQDHLEIVVRAVHEYSPLVIVWPLSLDPNQWQEVPLLYIAYLLEKEGIGSLIAFLKQLEWATSMVVQTNLFGDRFFNIEIYLTPAGHENVGVVLGLLFKYIDFLREWGIEQWVFDEFSAAWKNNFDFQEKIGPFEFTKRIASNMQMFPKESWLTGFFPSKFDPDLIKMVLELLSERKVRVFWLSDQFEMEMPEIEPSCGTRFSIGKLSAMSIENVMQLISDTDFPMLLPVPNRYIATDLSVKTWPLAHTGFLISETEFSKLRYKGNRFPLPKAIVKMRFKFPEIGLTLKAGVLIRIFTTMLLDSLKEIKSNTQTAGLYYDIEPLINGFEVTLSGFNDKMKSLLEFIVARIATFRISRNRFLNAKEAVIGEYESVAYGTLSEQADLYLYWILMEKEWSVEEKLDTCDDVEVEDLIELVKTMFSNTFLQFYIAGNLEFDEAKAMVNHVEDILFKQPKPLCGFLPSFLPVRRTAKLECCKNYYYRYSRPDQKISALIYYLQVIPDDPDLNSRSKLFVLMAKDPFFNLRADKDLAYAISLKTIDDSVLRGLHFMVESPVKAPGEIERIINAFLADFWTTLNCMTDEIFKGFVDTLVNMTLEKPKNLIEETTFFWKEERQLEVKAVRNLNLPKMKKFYKYYVRKGASKRRTLSIRVYGSQHQAEYESEYHSTESDDIEIDDVACIKDCLSFHNDFRAKK